MKSYIWSGIVVALCFLSSCGSEKNQVSPDPIDDSTDYSAVLEPKGAEKSEASTSLRKSGAPEPLIAIADSILEPESPIALNSSTEDALVTLFLKDVARLTLEEKEQREKVKALLLSRILSSAAESVSPLQPYPLENYLGEIQRPNSPFVFLISAIYGNGATIGANPTSGQGQTKIPEGPPVQVVIDWSHPSWPQPKRYGYITPVEQTGLGLISSVFYPTLKNRLTDLTPFPVRGEDGEGYFWLRKAEQIKTMNPNPAKYAEAVKRLCQRLHLAVLLSSGQLDDLLSKLSSDSRKALLSIGGI